MIPTFLIAFFSLIGLLIIHELGHFLLAKKFGVKVEEFGIGYPPRLFSKKVGGTVYSINILPFGAFVKMPGEVERDNKPGSFSTQPVSKRIWIALGGVISFWIIAAVILSFINVIGAPVAVEDDDVSFSDPRVTIVAVSKESPADIAGLRPGDVIGGFVIEGSFLEVDKIKEVKEITDMHRGEEISLSIKRGEESFETLLVPRVIPPEGEGSMGIGLVRVATERTPWYLAVFKGIEDAGRITVGIINTYVGAVKNLFVGKPSGMQVVGPIGVFQILIQSQQLGIVYFLNLLVLISIQLALFNMLPIPAVDGGRVMFLVIEAVRKKPLSEDIQQKAIVFSFIALLAIMVWVTISDIAKIF